MRFARRTNRGGATRSRLLPAFPILLLTLTLQQSFWPRRAGPLALGQVLAPYLFLTLLPLIPSAFASRAILLRLTLVASAVAFAVRYPPPIRFTARTAAPAAAQITVLNWNVRGTSRADLASRVIPVLAARPADIVVLEEANWLWLCCDPTVREAYPYSESLAVEGGFSGLVVLSTYRRIDSGAVAPLGQRGWNRVMWMRLDLGGGRELLVVAAHPRSPRIGPLTYRPDDREALIPAVRSVVDPALQRGDRVLLVGDLNTTEREPAYGDLSRGLRDAQRVAGQGWGRSWGISRGGRWLVPLLRIDYMFSGPGVEPLSLTTDCTPRGSDHCIVRGTFAIEGEAP